MSSKLASHQIAPHQMAAASRVHRTISYWRLGPLVTHGNWFQIFRAAPKSMLEDVSYDYVIKMVNPHLEGENAEIALDRLGREALSTDMFEHQGVIPLLDAELDRAPFFLVQPWFAGGSLDRFLATSDNVSLTRIVWIIRQVAEVIDTVHARGRVYLGLEPAHVLLGAGGRISLIGWSQSHAVAQPIRPPKERLQSARFTAPECFELGAIAKKASDIYSMGIFIYNSLLGRPPFNGSSYEAIVAAHRTEEPVDVIRHQPLCPTRLNQLIRQMLHKDPDVRPTISEVMDQLISIEIENLDNPAVILL